MHIPLGSEFDFNKRADNSFTEVTGFDVYRHRGNDKANNSGGTAFLSLFFT